MKASSIILLLGGGALALYLLTRKKEGLPPSMIPTSNIPTSNIPNIYDEPTPPIFEKPYEYQAYLTEILTDIKKQVPELFKGYIVTPPFIYPETIITGGGYGGGMTKGKFVMF